MAFAGTRLILHLAFSTIPGFAAVPISPSPSLPVLLFASVISLVTGIAFGIAPAWMAAGVDPIEALRGANRSTSRSASLPRKTLVVFQAALSLVLLSASGLLTFTLRNLEHQDFGFEQDRRVIVSMYPPLAGYRIEQLSSLYRRIHDSFSTLAGVSSVALCAYSPLNGDSWNDAVFVNGHGAPGPNENIVAPFDRVTFGYFDAIGTPILTGRGITERDTESSPHVAVINEAFAKRFFPHENPIGKRFGRSEMSAAGMYEVVGVAKDARYLTYMLDRPIGPMFFVPEAQHDVFSSAAYTTGDVRTHFMSDIVVEMMPGAKLSTEEARRVMAAVNRTLPVISVRTLREQVGGQFGQQRLIARLTSFFGILSVVLASIGLYGVTAYNAERRINEIGVRVALGADRGHILGMVLGGALSLIALGLLIGLPLTLAAGHFLGPQLYGTNPYNPLVFSISFLTLGFSALLASFVPAYRASLLSPLEALRRE